MEVKRILYPEDDVLLITGVPGWLGNRMLAILKDGDRYGNNAVSRKIRLLVEPKYKNSRRLPAGYDVFFGDVTDKGSLRPALQNVKTVYHLAGVIYPGDIGTYYKVNVEGTRNLADVCIEMGVRRLLYMSSDSICGYAEKGKVFTEDEPSRPYKDYGRSKFLSEKYIFDKTSEGLIDATSLRGFWFFGPEAPGKNSRFLKMFLWPRQIVFGDGNNLRSITHIDNLVQAFLKAEQSQKSIGKWYWIANREVDCTVNEIYKNVADGLGTVYRPVYVPGWICRFIGFFDTLLAVFGKVNPFIHAAAKFHRDIAGDISAAERDFNYQPDVGFTQIKEEVKEILLKNTYMGEQPAGLTDMKISSNGIH